jgi:hypothetical protein
LVPITTGFSVTTAVSNTGLLVASPGPNLSSHIRN